MKSIISRTFLILALVLFPHCVFSQEMPSSLPLFKTYGLSDGLSQISVSDVTEDKHGYLWLATQSGLDRFDGYDFKHFGKWKEDQNDGLHAITSFQVEASHDGEYIWVGTIAGISRFHVDSETFEHYILPNNSNIKPGIIKRIYIDNKGGVWVVSGKNLYSFSQRKNALEPIAYLTTPTSTLTDIFIDSNNTIWLGATSGGYKGDEDANRVALYSHSGKNISVLYPSPLGGIWVASEAKGACYYSSMTATKSAPLYCYNKASGLPSNSILAILELGNGDVWIATEAQTAIVFKNNAQNPVLLSPTSTRIANRRINTLFQSDSGLVIAGSRDNGFSVYNPKIARFSSYAIADTPNVTDLTLAANNQIWFTSDSGLWRYNPQTGDKLGPIKTASQNNELDSLDMLLSLQYHQSTGDIWLATRKGLGHFRPGDSQVDIVALEGTSGYTVNVDDAGDVWFGGYSDGVFVYRPSEQNVVRHWPLPLTTKIHFQNSESAWIATVSGLYFANKLTGDITNIGELYEGFPSSAVVTWVSPSMRGGFWVATQANGIYLISINAQKSNVEFVTPVTPHPHLSEISLGAIEEDENGSIWVSHSEGIAYISPDLEKVSYFGVENGVFENGYYVGASVQSDDGTIFMGGPSGITQFNPKNITHSPWLPNVKITQVEVVNYSEGSANITRIDNVEKLTLQPNEMSFSVEFAALEFTRPNDVSYAYKLADFDSAWRFTDASRRIATYTNLDAGSYTLIVHAINKEGVWSNEAARMEVIVVPAWWEKTLWQSIFVLTCFLLVVLIMKLRISALKKRSAHLARVVEEKTKDLEAAVTKLTQLSSQDLLTNLKNRRYFTQRSKEAWDAFQRYGQAFSLMLIDVDHFKNINDKYGHHAGDLILVKIADILRANLRSSDVIARWGGEEFLIFLPELNLHESYWVAEKIRKAISSFNFYCEGVDISVTITAGIADIRDCTSVEHCIHSADKKLYRGKAEGRNAIIK